MANFGGHCVVQNFDRLQVDVQARVAELRARGDIVNANRVLDAYVALRAGLDALGVRMAAKGTRILVEHERSSRVRPDTGGLGGKRLQDFLECAPVKAFGIHGAIGIADYDLLDAEVPWWWTQELGYAGNVGRIIFGAFFEPGGDTRPSAKLDKQHAIFEPRGDSASRAEAAGEGGEPGKRGSMEIRKQIGAKHFLEAGARVIEAEWLAGFETVMAAYIAQVAPIP